jgi:GNAT superfamily N-acetyltransferase
MKDLYTAAKKLYEQAFPGEEEDFTAGLFALGFPQHLEGIAERGKLLSMLFALPYPVISAEGELPARYLYAVATDPEQRGKGYAKQLLREIIAEGKPVFLRPMSPSLFQFYKDAGFTPFSPYREVAGEAACDFEGVASLSAREYLSARDGFLSAPYCRMTEDFLALCFTLGGAVGKAGEFAALYELDGDTVLFKEFWGDPKNAPRAAAFLGAKQYTARFSDPTGTPFGVCANLPADTVFLAALD